MVRHHENENGSERIIALKGDSSRGVRTRHIESLLAQIPRNPAAGMGGGHENQTTRGIRVETTPGVKKKSGVKPSHKE